MKDILRDNFMDAILPLTHKTWLHFGGFYILLNLLPAAIVAVLLWLTSPEPINRILQLLGASDPEAMLAQQEALEAYLEQFSWPPASLAVVGLGLMLMLLCAGWLVNAAITINQQAAEGSAQPFWSTLTGALNMQAVQVILFYLLLIGATLLYFILIGALSSLSGWLMVLGTILYFLLLAKLAIVLPAICIGQQDAARAFVYSWKQVSTGTALKVWLVLLVYLVVVILATSFVSLFGFALAGMVPLLAVVGNLLSLLVTIYLTAMLYAGMTAFYYSYALEETEYTV